MKSIKERYKNADNGVCPLIFLVFALINCTVVLFLQNMSLEQEYSGTASAALLLGRDWFSAMPAINGAGGLLQGIIYLPSMLLCPDPGTQYKLFLITNSVVYSFIPVIAYKIAMHLGVEKPAHRVLAAAVCGAFPTLLIHSHLLLSDGFASVMIWLLLLFILRDESGHSKPRRFFVSVAAATFTAAAYYFSPACFVLFPAVLAALILLRSLSGREGIFISVYVVAYLLLFAADFVITFIMDFTVPGGADGGLYGVLTASLTAFLANPADFAALFAGRLYHLIVSSWGLAAASAALGVYALISCIKRKKSAEKIFDESYAVGSTLCTLMILLLALGDAFVSLSDYPDGGVISPAVSVLVAAPATFMLFVHLIKYKISYGRLMASITTIGASGAAVAALLCCLAPHAFTEEMSVICGDISALRIGASVTEPFTTDSVIYPICLILTAFAAMTAVVCCAKKYAGSIVTYICTGLIAYSAVYIAAAIVPLAAVSSAESAGLSAAVSEYIENGSTDGSRPLVAVYRTDEKLAMNLQYFNQSCEVVYVSDESRIPDDCFIVSEQSVSSDGLCVLIGRENGINIYVKGEETLLYTGLNGGTGQEGAGTVQPDI
ncbi:MAG: hypothetical protein J1E39_08070 [Eubacterium sp.]|nr:hypothetical protein [Eubacterium sp.]